MENIETENRPKEKYLLKIIAGPNQGAEVALDEEELVIGSGSECDLILSDMLVSDRHVKVVVSKGGVFVVPLVSPTYLNGEEMVKDEQMRLDPFQFISVGTTHFVVGPIGGEWPALSSADVPTLTKREEEVEKPEEEAVVEGEKPAEAVLEEALEEEKWDKKRKILMGSGGAVAFLMLLIVVVFLLFEPKPVKKEEVPMSAQIEQVLDNLGYREGFDIREQKGIYIVEGWVNTNDDRDKVSAAFYGLGGNVRLEVWSQEQVMMSINELLNVWKLPISAESMEPGKVRVYGYFWHDDEWEKAKREIERDIQGIKYLEDDVYTPKRLGPIVAEVLEKNGLVGKLQFVPAQDMVEVKGLLNKEDVGKMRDAISEFQAKVENRVPLKNQVLLAKAEDLYTNLNMDSVIIGDQGFIITKDGRRVFEGGTLEGGYLVEKIDREKIILRKGTQTITLNLGENYVR